ncbi:MAG: ATP-binding protein [Blastocatellia bacterium]|nr:ATP-binding protein [Blastocatellia bacterium]
MTLPRLLRREFPLPEKLFSHQQAAYTELRRVACGFFGQAWQPLPVRPRSNLLITGPTGLGKTELVRTLTAELDLPMLELVFTDWLPMGTSNRGSIHTWPMILNFIEQNERALIFIDEVDKAIGSGDWSIYIRLELFSLLDHKIPENIEIEDVDDEDKDSRRKRIASAQQKLERSFLLVGAGAFQGLCESRSAGEIGFQSVASVGELALRELAGVLPRELTNRFRSKLINLPPLRHECYLEMLTKVARRMPPELAKAFVTIGRATVGEAVRNQQGVRWLEEITLDAMIESGLHTQTKPREPVPELDCAA